MRLRLAEGLAGSHAARDGQTQGSKSSLFSGQGLFSPGFTEDCVCVWAGAGGQRKDKTTGQLVTTPGMATSSIRNVGYELLCLQPRFFGPSRKSAIVWETPGDSETSN